MPPSLTYFLPDTSSSWVDRIDAACAVLEESFGVQLLQAQSRTENAPNIRLNERKPFLKKKLGTKNRWFCIYSGTGYRQTETGLENLDYYSLGGCSYPLPQLYKVVIEHPAVRMDKQEELVVRLGDALGAYSGQYTPTKTLNRLNRVQDCQDFGSGPVKKDAGKQTPEESALPLLLNCEYMGLESALQPRSLGWINYWSREVCDNLEFPDPARDSLLLQQSRRTPAGAWLVKLGAEPLDASNARHVQLLTEAYTRFSGVGVRILTKPRIAGPTGTA